MPGLPLYLSSLLVRGEESETQPLQQHHTTSTRHAPMPMEVTPASSTTPTPPATPRAEPSRPNTTPTPPHPGAQAVKGGLFAHQQHSLLWLRNRERAARQQCPEGVGVAMGECYRFCQQAGHPVSFAAMWMELPIWPQWHTHVAHSGGGSDGHGEGESEVMSQRLYEQIYPVLPPEDGVQEGEDAYPLSLTAVGATHPSLLGHALARNISTNQQQEEEEGDGNGCEGVGVSLYINRHTNKDASWMLLGVSGGWRERGDADVVKLPRGGLFCDEVGGWRG